MKILSRPAFISLVAVFAAIPAQAQISANYSAGGSVILGYDSTICTNTIEGALRYSSATKLLERCNGTEWGKLPGLGGAGATSTAPTGTGYFILTSGSFNGNMPGISGANAKCLADLTANDWMGKADATTRGIINASHIEAFLCVAGLHCTNAVPGVTYYFGVSGDNTMGGASFVADAGGLGPNDANNWSGATYFGSAVQYWTGRSAGMATAWAATTAMPSFQQCAGWTSTSVAESASYGISSSTNGARFSDATGSGNICAATKKMICFVHP